MFSEDSGGVSAVCVISDTSEEGGMEITEEVEGGSFLKSKKNHLAETSIKITKIMNKYFNFKIRWRF